MDWRYQFYACFGRDENHSRISRKNLPKTSLCLYARLAKKEGEERSAKKVKSVKTLFWMLVFVLVILFSIQNKDEVILRFGLYPIRDYRWEVPRIPLFLVILFSISLGVLIGSLGDLYRHFQLKKAIRQHQKIIDRLEREIQSFGGSRLDKSSFLEENV
jgi:uncharacterized integral membrane protein